MAGGQPYVVDCGYGTVRALVEAGIRVNDVRNTFLTHLHNDHTGGFGRAAVSPNAVLRQNRIGTLNK
jgi:ribonuclease BN (tRNA processing enzyme)